MRTNLKHIAELSNTMRQEDKDEIWHLARLSPMAALVMSYDLSKVCYTTLVDNRVAIIGGVGSHPTEKEVGVPWMLASPLLKEIRRDFIKEIRDWVWELSRGYKMLRNVAWSKNETHIRWLKWMGFEMGEGMPLGPDGEIYIPFWKHI